MEENQTNLEQINNNVMRISRKSPTTLNNNNNPNNNDSNDKMTIVPFKKYFLKIFKEPKHY